MEEGGKPICGLTRLTCVCPRARRSGPRLAIQRPHDVCVVSLISAGKILAVPGISAVNEAVCGKRGCLLSKQARGVAEDSNIR